MNRKLKKERAEKKAGKKVSKKQKKLLTEKKNALLRSPSRKKMNTGISSAKKARLTDKPSQPPDYGLYRAIAEQLADWVVVRDTDGRITFASESFAAFLGFTSDAIKGLTVSAFMSLPAIQNRMTGSFKQALTAWNGMEQNHESVRVEFSTPAFAVFSCEFGAIQSGSWIRMKDMTAQSQSESMIAVAAKDLENRKFDFEKRYREMERSQSELERMKHDILEANRLKSEFLANMSHELRTPLNSILALSSILLTRMDGELNEEQEKQIIIIERSGKNLLRLINDILDLSKIEAGRMDLIISEYDVLEFVENIKMTIMPLIRESSLEFIADIDPSIEVHSTDENKLKQILLNLLSNAVKFTPNGSVTLRIQPTKFADVLEFSVIDTGIGIDSSHFDTIFDPFRQLDGSATRKYGGTGLGLAITKKIVELLGGRLTVESEIGKGSAFRFFIPSRRRGMENNILTENEIEQMIRQTGTGRKEEETDTFTVQLDSEKKTILLIDDDKESLYIMKKYIDGNLYQTLMAKDGDDGIAKAVEFQPDIIVLDIMMPKKDGWIVLQELKQNAVTRQIPVMIISIVDNKKLGFSLGASDYIVKPVVKDMLLKRISKLCAEKELKRILIVDDDLTQAELVEEILQSDDYLSEVATSGEMAIQLVRRKSYDLIILDLLMPQVDGFVVLDNLRNDPIANKTPVLILTGKLLTKDDQEKLSGKNYHLFMKSMFSREKLLEEIHAILGRN